MASQFFVNPLGGFNAGQAVANIGESIQQRQQMDEQEQAIEEQRAIIGRVMQGDDSAIPELYQRNPNLAANLEQRAIQRANAQDQQQAQAAINANKEFIQRYWATPREQRQQLLQSVANDPSMSLVTVDDDLLQMSPEAQEQEAKMATYGLMGKDFYEQFVQKPEPKQDLTSGQKEYQMAVQQGFEGSFLDYKKALSEDPAQNLEMMKLRAQLEDIESRREAREADLERTKRLDNKKTKQLVRGIDNVIAGVDQAVTQLQGPLTTGVGGAVTGAIPGTPAYKLRSTIQTIKANLGFDRLQQMREASPTGGALGAVSERELSDLQATVANLDPNQGAEQLRENLLKVREHYNNWKQTLVGENPDETGEDESQNEPIDWNNL